MCWSSTFAQFHAHDTAMIHGLYLSAQGANAQIVRQDVISNNLANASTTGFKRDVAEMRFWEPGDLGRQNIPIHMQGGRENAVGAITLDRTTTIFKDSALENTGNAYDIAIRSKDGEFSDGFFQVRDGNGQSFLTRAGRLNRTPEGLLVSDDTQNPILDSTGGLITVPPGDIRVDEAGTVYSTDEDDVEKPFGKIGLFTAPTDQLRKVGANLFAVDARQITPASNAVVQHKYLEASGVDPTRELVSLIDASRTFEANVNMLRMQDESLGRLLQSFSA